MPTILADMNWTATKAHLMTVPPNLASCICTIFMAYLSNKTRKRGPSLMALSTVGVVGMAVLRWESTANLRCMGIFFVMCGGGSGGPGFLSWAINNAAGAPVRAITSAYVVSLRTFGGLVAT